MDMTCCMLCVHKCTHVQLQILDAVQGPRTEKGLRTNISVGLIYLEAWLGGSGCIPIHSMMEDAATAEIARTQVRGVPGFALSDGVPGAASTLGTARHSQPAACQPGAVTLFLSGASAFTCCPWQQRRMALCMWTASCPCAAVAASLGAWCNAAAWPSSLDSCRQPKEFQDP